MTFYAKPTNRPLALKGWFEKPKNRLSGHVRVKKYLKLLNRLYDITCSTISNIPYNLIFTTTFNDSSILITIISCDFEFVVGV
jgi:hypothetical protein